MKLKRRGLVQKWNEVIFIECLEDYCPTSSKGLLAPEENLVSRGGERKTDFGPSVSGVTNDSFREINRTVH